MPAFRALDEAQLEVLRAAMSVAKFEDGERVFDQGDEGDAFYLITTGHCEVLRFDPAACMGEDGGEERMGRLHKSDCFGERALLYAFGTLRHSSSPFDALCCPLLTVAHRRSALAAGTMSRAPPRSAPAPAAVST